MLPIKSKIKGNFPYRNAYSSCKKRLGHAPIQADETKEDIIEEAIKYFRINVLYRNFEIKGDADKLMIFLTVLIQKILDIIASAPKKEDADKNLGKFILETMPVAGEAGFFMGGMVTKAVADADNFKFREYLKHLRAETIKRMMQL